MVSRQRWLSVLVVLAEPTLLVAAGEIERWYMNEEWYDWHSRAEFSADAPGTLTVEVHFVGPGAVTPRGVYVRGDADAPLEDIRVSATCVRVPVFVGHGQAVWIETEKYLSPAEVRDILRQSPGVVVMDDVTGDNGSPVYPTNLDVNQYRDQVMVGRIREDTSCENGLTLWIVADNLRKGAALNVVQIAEELVRKGILKV